MESESPLKPPNVSSSSAHQNLSLIFQHRTGYYSKTEDSDRLYHYWEARDRLSVPSPPIHLKKTKIKLKINYRWTYYIYFLLYLYFALRIIIIICAKGE